jgi:hypothetical protein
VRRRHPFAVIFGFYFESVPFKPSPTILSNLSPGGSRLCNSNLADEAGAHDATLRNGFKTKRNLWRRVTLGASYDRLAGAAMLRCSGVAAA